MRIIQILPFCTCKNALFVNLTRGNAVSFNTSGGEFYLAIFKSIPINVSREVNGCVYGFNQLSLSFLVPVNTSILVLSLSK